MVHRERGGRPGCPHDNGVRSARNGACQGCGGRGRRVDRATHAR
ncbi:hypothetical protein BURCENBC7_AP4058 [Burkholderia cenocepacia BC7]|nr:hypothetical protein BURCENK562V_C5338 [Burkholderia cenocepacia K56-2Valvano]ERI29536.1 hypothetical protein BURCENBC7_AP4058 [Burkholderia cenocepacia BC7]